VKYLVEDEKFQPSNINMNDINKVYPLITAIQFGESKIFSYLLDHRTSSYSNISDGNGNNLLSIAIDKDQCDIVRCLLNHNININRRDANNCYPLNKAILKNRSNIVKAMVRYGLQKHIDLNILDINGNPPLIIAYRQGHLELFKFLAKYLDINKKDTNGNSVLFYTVYNDDFSNMKYLIRLGADMNGRNKVSRSLVDILLMKKNKDMLLYLLQKNYKISVNAKNIKGETILITLIKSTVYNEQDKLDILPILIEKGSDVNQENSGSGNFTPLYYAIQIKSLPLVKLLVQNGANVNYFLHSKNQSLLMYAIEIGDLTIIDYLIDCNAIVKHVFGPSAWEIALRKGQLNIIKCLSKRHIEDITGDQLHQTIASNNLEQLKLLVSSGLDPDLKNTKGNTLLAMAILFKQINIINYLIDIGANLYSTNNEGKSILDLATQYLKGNSNNANNIRQFGFNSSQPSSDSFNSVYMKIKNLCGK
jgi:ankyrin repeat protein